MDNVTERQLRQLARDAYYEAAIRTLLARINDGNLLEGYENTGEDFADMHFWQPACDILGLDREECMEEVFDNEAIAREQGLAYDRLEKQLSRWLESLLVNP